MVQQELQRKDSEAAVSTLAASAVPACVIIHRLWSAGPRDGRFWRTQDPKCSLACFSQKFGQFFSEILGKITFTLRQMNLLWSRM